MVVTTVKDLFYHLSDQILRIEKPTLIQRIAEAAAQYPNSTAQWTELGDRYVKANYVTDVLPQGRRMFVFLTDLLTIPLGFPVVELNTVYEPRILDETVHSALHANHFGNIEHYLDLASSNGILSRDGTMSQEGLMELYSMLFFVCKPEILLGSVVEKDRVHMRTYMRQQAASAWIFE